MTKSTHQILYIILFFLLAVLYFIQFSSSSNTENIPTVEKELTIQPLNEGGLNIAFVNSDTVSKYYKLPIIFSAHPRTKKKIESKKIKFDPLVKLIKPLGYIDYVHLQMNSSLVISDSGTISEESSILNFNAINLRESHERPEAMENPPLVMSGLNVERVTQSIDSVLETALNNSKLVRDYNEDNVSTKVERILLSYTDYVNRVVWQKES